jgi:hypothetical protein
MADSFTWNYGIRWLTPDKIGTVGSDRQTLGGDIISYRLPVKKRDTKHRFRSEWEDLAMVETLTAAANDPGQVYTVDGKRCVFPPDPNITAKFVPPEDGMLFAAIRNTAVDLWDIEFDVILLED